MGRRECKDRQAAGPAPDLGCGARLLRPIGSCCSTRTLCLCRQACVWICVVRRLLLLVFVVVLSSPALPGFAATGPEARVSDLQKNKDKRGENRKKWKNGKNGKNGKNDGRAREGGSAARNVGAGRSTQRGERTTERTWRRTRRGRIRRRRR